jgi:hypothetical protein
MTKYVWGYLQVLRHLKKGKKLTNKEHDFFYKLLQIFKKIVILKVHLSFFFHFQCGFITFFNTSTFYFQKKSFKVFNNYLMSNLTQSYNNPNFFQLMKMVASTFHDKKKFAFIF